MDFRGSKFTSDLWLLIPTFSLPSAPPRLAAEASSLLGMLSYRYLACGENTDRADITLTDWKKFRTVRVLSKTVCDLVADKITRVFGNMLSPGKFSAQSAI